MDNKNFKSGFVAIVGRPNVGKSTFMNRIIKEQIAITSPKAQTTRNKIQGIYTDDERQIIFLDTPGIHKPHNDLDQYMDKAAISALKEVDAVLFMTEAGEQAGPGDKFIIEELKKVKAPVFLVLNKIDLINPDEMAPQIDEYKDLMDFAEVIPISATNGNNVEDLFDTLTKHLPEGPQYYAADQITDHPEYFIVGELIREKILEDTRDEIPHSVAVVVESMKQRSEAGKLQVEAYIYVERESQKPIVIGRGGSMLKNIGIGSRIKIEHLLGEKINLKLWVRVKKNWRDDPAFLASAGYSLKDLNN
ncbi:GTPase Era [Companilactobacillus halodurans]|uniref:GTPase Era n=1 Tax=Companilactobacillus halodurans TaxID=2584183 RepID=A0A5P0ZQA9_9LACO|nr:GTPase Era [Companilactobacillus halodurans]MQS76051.1 GTPase Era [Companilactobacillus halodurans]MQS96487.1 GTPase Era [Companilactobacillus halodurans]